MTRTGASTGTQTPAAGHTVDAKGRSTHGDGRLEEAFVTRVLEASDLLAVIGTRVSLKKAGTQFVGLCPFHTEKSPSFSVSPSRGYYHCFGCGAGGDALSFLMAYDGLPFRDAVESLASAAGIAMPRADDAPPSVTRHELTAAFDALETAARFYERSLRAAPHAIAYARGRGLVGETARRYRLGYAPAGWHALSAALPGYEHSPAVVDAGLVVEKDGRRYDRSVVGWSMTQSRNT
jgi:DNA primase